MRKRRTSVESKRNKKYDWQERKDTGKTYGFGSGMREGVKGKQYNASVKWNQDFNRFIDGGQKPNSNEDKLTRAMKSRAKRDLEAEGRQKGRK